MDLFVFGVWKTWPPFVVLVWTIFLMEMLWFFHSISQRWFQAKPRAFFLRQNGGIHKEGLTAIGDYP